MPIQVNQCEYSALTAQGYFGSINKMRRDWEKDNAIITSTDFYKKLIEAGYTGAFPDMERDFWCEAGGSFNLIKGWTDGIDCTGGSGEVVLEFPGEVSFTSQTGISVYTSTDGGDTEVKTLGAITPTLSSPTISYAGTWSADLVSGDVVYWKAAAGNNHVLDGKALGEQLITLTNCLDAANLILWEDGQTILWEDDLEMSWET